MLLDHISCKHPSQLLVHAELIFLRCNFHLVVLQLVQNLKIGLPINFSKSHSLNEITKWRHWLVRHFLIQNESGIDVGTVFEQLVDSLSISTDEGLTDGRYLVLVHFIHVYFVFEKQVETLHLVRLYSKVKQSLTVVVHHIWVALLSFEEVNHAVIKNPLVRVGEVFNVANSGKC